MNPLFGLLSNKKVGRNPCGFDLFLYTIVKTAGVLTYLTESSSRGL